VTWTGRPRPSNAVWVWSGTWLSGRVTMEDPGLARLRDLAASHHRYSDGNRLKIGRQSIGPIDNLPSCDRTVRGGFEPDTLDTLLTAREYHSVSGVILALNQTGEDGLGCGRPSGSQCIPKIRETVCVTQKIGKLSDFLSKQLFRWMPHQDPNSVTMGISSGNLIWHK
jgi:hypothetical protein